MFVDLHREEKVLAMSRAINFMKPALNVLILIRSDVHCAKNLNR